MPTLTAIIGFGMPSMTALLGLLTLAGFLNSDVWYVLSFSASPNAILLPWQEARWQGH